MCFRWLREGDSVLKHWVLGLGCSGLVSSKKMKSPRTLNIWAMLMMIVAMTPSIVVRRRSIEELHDRHFQRGLY